MTTITIDGKTYQCKPFEKLVLNDVEPVNSCAFCKDIPANVSVTIELTQTPRQAFECAMFLDDSAPEIDWGPKIDPASLGIPVAADHA